MKILITGGFGYLGSWLTEYYCGKHYDVTVLSRTGNKPLKGLNCRFIKADITDPKDLKIKVKDGFDYCLHTASANNHFAKDYARKALLVNALGTRNIVEVLAQKKIKKFLYFSTFHVYNANKEVMDEALLPSPANDYASTHLFAEYYLKQFYNSGKFPYLILRLTNCYGAPKEGQSTAWRLVVNDLAKMAFEQGRIVLNSRGDSIRDFIWLGDVCSITEKLLMAGYVVNDTFNVSSGFTYKIMDIANIIGHRYKKRYGKNIAITAAAKDSSPIIKNANISNKKLHSVIRIRMHNKLFSEIDKIFAFLEGRH